MNEGSEIDNYGTERYWEGGKIVYVKYTDGFQSWWKNGYRHKEDGPAIIFGDNKPMPDQWWYNGERIKCNSQQEFERMLRLKAFW